MDILDTCVAIASAGGVAYPDAPFSSGVVHAEFMKLPERLAALRCAGKLSGGVYEGVREVLYALGLDREHANSATWNPFGKLVRAGQSVVLKPNLVMDRHPLGDLGTRCTITHASILRPLIDYVILATGGDVVITICDVPLQSASWKRLVDLGGYRELVDFYATVGVRINLGDYRKEIAVMNRDGVLLGRKTNAGDPSGYVAVDLGQASAMQPLVPIARRLRITDYPDGTVEKHHNARRNEYLITKTVLEADFFINVAKLKTHRKSGMTCCMKNLIGINGDKSWIAHHRTGSPSHGGDEYARFSLRQWLVWHTWNFLKTHASTLWAAVLIKRLYYLLVTRGRTIEDLKFAGDSEECMEGSWYGNDTVWRCVADLNQILLHADANGSLHDVPQRHYLGIVDAIIAGEGEGPMQNTPKPLGLILGGINPWSIDWVACQLMAFDWTKIPTLAKTRAESSFAYGKRPFPTVVGAVPVSPFKPNRLWSGHVESAESLILHPSKIFR